MSLISPVQSPVLLPTNGGQKQESRPEMLVRKDRVPIGVENIPPTHPVRENVLAGFSVFWPENTLNFICSVVFKRTFFLLRHLKGNQAIPFLCFSRKGNCRIDWTVCSAS